jgi:intracellular septation protein
MEQAQKKHSSWLEYGPLLLFFITNYFKGIMWGTAVLVLATALALAYSWVKYRKIPMMALVGGVAVALFGGLTLYFNDEFFIKIKPTVISLLFALVLVVGQLTGRNMLKMLLGGQMNMAEEGWYRLGWLWSAMFVTSAIANEIAWRSLSTDGWVAFKAFGLTGISLLFAVASIPVFTRYSEDLKEF